MEKLNFVFIFSIFAILFSLSTILAVGDSIYFGNYKFSYDYNEYDASPGEIFSLRVSIKNEGNFNVSNVFLEFDDFSPFSFDEDSWKVGDLNAGETKSKNFRVRIKNDASEKRYKIPFSFEDNNEDYEDSINVLVKSRDPRLIIGDIKSSPNVISADLKNIELKLKIEPIKQFYVELNYYKSRLSQFFPTW